MSPLYLDAEDENIEIVKILLQEKNLDINSLSKFSFENPEENYKLMLPLHAAVQKENTEIIQLLLENESIDAIAINIELPNGKPNKRRERTALDIAIENKSLETILILISSEKVYPNLPWIYFSYRDEDEEWNSEIDEKERTHWHVAIYKNNIEILKLLLNSKRIDLNHLQIELKSEFLMDDSEEWDERRVTYGNPTFETSYLWSDTPNKWILTLCENKNEETPLYFTIETK